MDVTPFPFATVDELKARWPDFPTGADTYAKTQLEDASQFILDVAPSAAQASANTRRRIVCAVVKRAMKGEDDDFTGMESVQIGTGPFQDTYKPVNPNGDYYLTGQEKLALGVGRARAFSISMIGAADATQDH